jgi:cytoskeletal protein CcmA (bactofilin family)
VTVRGTVKGDLVTGAQRVEIAGAVEGNVFSFSETMTVRGPIGKSLHSFAQHVGLGAEGRVEGDVFTFAEESDLDGHVGRDLLAFTGLTNLRGEVARNLSAWTGKLRVEGPAKIGGDLTAHVDRKDAVFVDPQASVGGKTETRLPVERGSRFSEAGFYLWKAIWLAAAFVTGLLLYRLFPWLFAGRLADARALLLSLGIGFGVLVAAPVAIVLVGLTVVGLPVALLALGLWLAGLYLSSILVSEFLGRTLLSRGAGPGPSFARALFVGLSILTVAGTFPYLGGLVSALVMPIGLGLGASQIARSWRPAATS